VRILLSRSSSLSGANKSLSSLPLSLRAQRVWGKRVRVCCEEIQTQKRLFLSEGKKRNERMKSEFGGEKAPSFVHVARRV